MAAPMAKLLDKGEGDGSCRLVEALPPFNHFDDKPTRTAAVMALAAETKHKATRSTQLADRARLAPGHRTDTSLYLFCLAVVLKREVTPTELPNVAPTRIWQPRSCPRTKSKPQPIHHI